MKNHEIKNVNDKLAENENKANNVSDKPVKNENKANNVSDKPAKNENKANNVSDKPAKNENKVKNTGDKNNNDILLEVKNLSIAFGGLKAVDDLNMNIRKGQLYGLIGPNGAGKTTVFNMLTGVYKPTAGYIKLDGEKIDGLSPMNINRKGIARTFQNIRLFGNMSIIDNVKLGLNNKQKYTVMEGILRLPRFFKEEKAMNEKAMELLKVFDLDEDINTLASNLPYGKQRKLEIARALATDPKLLLLDEPAAGMNPNETAELMETIQFVREKYGVTILLIEHDMKLVSGICEEIMVLNFGTELAHGKPEEVLNKPEVITAYLGE